MLGLKSIIGMTSAVMLLGACAIATPTYTADGRKGYSISCDGAAVGINVCYEKAGELCGSRGYDLYDQSGAIIPVSFGSANISANRMVASGNAFSYGGAFYTKSIRIACR